MAFIGNTNITQAFTPAVDFFSGNGSTTAFTLSRPVASVAQVEVYVSNVPQTPSTAYTVSGNTITFTSAPLSGTNNIYVYYTSPITQVIAPGQNTVYPSSLSTTNALYWDTSGNVGIGTSSPAQKLHVASAASAGNVYSLIDSSGTANGYNAANLYKNSERQFRVGVLGTVGGFTNGALVVYDETAAAWRMVIDSSGNVGIGTTSPSTFGLLAVENASNARAGWFYVSAASSLSTPSVTFVKKDNNTTTSQVLANFYVNGSLTAQGQINANGASAAAFGSFSDRRLKENIVDLPSQLANIMALRPVEFDYIESEGGGHQIGFIAQEVQQVYPDLVGEREDGMLTLTDLNKNDARLIKAIQEQQALITALTARIEALENK